MAEYINRERARFEAEHYFKGLDNIQEDLDMLFCMLPAEDVAPVRHGRWVQCNYMGKSAKCSECGGYYTRFTVNERYPKYCLHCGTKMDLGG